VQTLLPIKKKKNTPNSTSNNSAFEK